MSEYKEEFPIVMYKYTRGDGMVHIREGMLVTRETNHKHKNDLSKVLIEENGYERNGTKYYGNLYKEYCFSSEDSYWLCQAACKEGVWLRNTFWLKKRDDKKAKQIIKKKYLEPAKSTKSVRLEDM